MHVCGLRLCVWPVLHLSLTQTMSDTDCWELQKRRFRK